jgi:ABC-2 type transport system ATP-binding protein
LSLAVALLHEPLILILDEPTIGIDPLIRAKLWDHLKGLTTQGVTIIITTHYIEDARLADAVGLMRRGMILEEGNFLFLYLFFCFFFV